jgi:hypothetical protein
MVIDGPSPSLVGVDGDERVGGEFDGPVGPRRSRRRSAAKSGIGLPRTVDPVCTEVSLASHPWYRRDAAIQRFWVPRRSATLSMAMLSRAWPWGERCAPRPRREPPHAHLPASPDEARKIRSGSKRHKFLLGLGPTPPHGSPNDVSRCPHTPEAPTNSGRVDKWIRSSTGPNEPSGGPS